MWTTNYFTKNYFSGSYWLPLGELVAVVVTPGRGERRKEIFINKDYIFDLYPEDSGITEEIDIDLGNGDHVKVSPKSREKIEDLIYKHKDKIELIQGLDKDVTEDRAVQLLREVIENEYNRSIVRARILLEDQEILLILLATDLI